MEYSIKVGVFDWQRFPGSGDYYPDDLPPDWRLQFYSNEFETACLDASALLAQDPAGDQFEDVGEDFELSLALTSPSDYAAVSSFAADCPCPIRYLVVADSMPGDAAARRLEGLTRVPLGAIWTPQLQPASAAFIARMPGGATPRQYRNWIEQWLQTAPAGTELTLWLDAPGSDFQTLLQCRQLVELMGY